MTKQRTALFVALRGFALARSRFLLMKALQDRGWKVVMLTEDDEHSQWLVSQGMTLEKVSFGHGRAGAGKELGTIRRVIEVFKKYRPELVHCFSAKPIIYGGMASFASPKSKIVNTVTGLGNAFEAGGLTRKLAAMGFKAVLSRAKATIFQNDDDLGIFTQNNWVSKDKARLIVGSGVDVFAFKPNPIPPSQRRRVLMTARLVWQKGVREYVEAAETLKSEFPDVTFVLAGELIEGRAEGVDRAFIDEAVKRGGIEFAGYLKDFAGALADTRIFVLPSYYREGVPRVLLESAAAGVPVVTADSPGCRDAVRHGETGLIVPPRDVAALTEALRTLLKDGAMCDRMAEAGRRLAEKEFDIRSITQRQIDIYAEIGANP